MSIEHINRISTDSAEAEHSAIDSGKVVAGDPQQTLWHCFTNAEQNFSAGHWQGTPGTHNVNYTEDEVICILDGKIVLTDTEGNEVSFGKGDIFAISAGFSGTWTTVETVDKLYVSYEK